MKRIDLCFNKIVLLALMLITKADVVIFGNRYRNQAKIRYMQCVDELNTIQKKLGKHEVTCE